VGEGGSDYIADNGTLAAAPQAMDMMDRIESALDDLRPYIASHRGSVEVVDFDQEEGILTLRMGGTCHGCSASTVTLRQGIEVRLRQTVPEVKVVQSL
jgi:Fe-S cluster biogenesis protein NfuA